jgi:hypothetical protein
MPYSRWANADKYFVRSNLSDENLDLFGSGYHYGKCKSLAKEEMY